MCLHALHGGTHSHKRVHFTQLLVTISRQKQSGEGLCRLASITRRYRHRCCSRPLRQTFFPTVLGEIKRKDRRSIYFPTVPLSDGRHRQGQQTRKGSQRQLLCNHPAPPSTNTAATQRSRSRSSNSSSGSDDGRREKKPGKRHARVPN